MSLRRVDRLYRRGLRAHKRRRVGEALRAYRRVLEAEPPLKPDDVLAATIRANAPILRCASDEPLPLKDVAAIYSSSRRTIGYHLFYEDDIDFPNDSEPCDHEVLWVELDEGSRRSTAVCCYYHGRVLRSDESFGSDGRPEVVVQWGKHGTLPLNWSGDSRLVADMKRTWERLHTAGAREQDTPLARFWPDRYTGSWEEFAQPQVRTATEPLVARDGFMLIGDRATAILDYCMIPYNFAVKYAWPDGLY